MAEDPCEVWFYHLERSGLGEVLPELLERTLARGWRALVWSPDADQLARLDEHLWTYQDASFLPHSLAGGPMDAAQPVLLSTTLASANGAQALFVVDGDPGELPPCERCIIVFDGRSETALAQTRVLWTRYRRAGLALTYWRQGPTRGWIRQN